MKIVSLIWRSHGKIARQEDILVTENTVRIIFSHDKSHFATLGSKPSK